MADILSSAWSPLQAGNSTTPPDGLPTGSAPNKLAPMIRETMAATRRQMERMNAIATTTGASNTYVLTYTGGPDALRKGEAYVFWANHTNTGTATLNINGLGAKAILKPDGSPIVAGQIVSGTTLSVEFDGTNFRMTTVSMSNPVFNGTVAAADLTLTGGIAAATLSGNGAALTNLNASNIATGTIADARLPGTMTGKTINGQLWVNNSTYAAGGDAVILRPTDYTTGKPGLWLAQTANTARWNIGLWDGASTAGEIRINAGTFTHNGNVVWTTANDGPGSGLSADTSDKLNGQTASYYLNASNISAGTLADTRLPASMSPKTFTGSIYINEPGAGSNSHVWLQNQGVNRGLMYYNPGGSQLVWNLYNTSGTYVRQMDFRQSDGRLYVNGFVQTEGNVNVGAGGSYVQTDGNVKFTGGMAGYGSMLSNALDARIKNDGGTYGINITGNAATATRAYPRKSDGGNINFIWSGQAGSPTWVWGGSNGTDMYVYSPSNMNVAWANNSGNADTVDDLHGWQFMRSPSTSTSSTETNFPIGHHVMTIGFHIRNALANVFNDGGNVNQFTISGGTGGAQLAGTWQMRGSHTAISGGLSMCQRTA